MPKRLVAPGCDPEGPSIPVDLPASLAKDAQNRMQMMTHNDIPFFLRTVLDRGRQAMTHEHEGRKLLILEPVAFSLAMAARWWEPCSRRDEWQLAPAGGTATIPPCFAAYADRNIRDCTESVKRACCDEVASHLSISPDKLKAMSERARSERIKKAQQDDSEFYDRSRRPVDPSDAA